MPVLRIDGKEVEVEKGTNLIIAALKAGVYIPHYCYHPLLKVVAQCRMCFVKIEGVPRPTTACTVTVDKDMVVDTKDEKVKKLRNLALEFLLQHHPVDCPVCPRSGECDLQNFTYIWGPERKRYDGKRRLKGWIRVSEKIILFKERCVLCTRCVRFLRDFTKTGGLSVTQRGFLSDLTIFPEKFADGSKYSGNIIDLCPVGALVDEASSYLPRAWRVQRTLTHCPMCERGCRVVVEAWENKIVRVKTFDNMLDKAEESLYSQNKNLIQPAYSEIIGIEDIGAHSYDKLYTQDLIMCDIGRWEWRNFFFPKDTNPLSVRGGIKEEISWEDTKKVARTFLSYDKKAILVTPYATNEEMTKFKELAEKVDADITLLPPLEGEEDDILIKRRKAPNYIGGCNILGGVKDEVISKIKSGQYSALIYYGMGANKGSISQKDLRGDFIVIIDLRLERDDFVGVFIPATLPYEKSGHYTFEGNPKKINPACERIPYEIQLCDSLI